MTAGVVLCGGRSRRMGTDKAFVEVDGVPMVARVAAALAAGGCDEVHLVGGDGELLARFGHPTVADRFPGEGPAGGVLTAVDAVGGDGIVVVASCDVPLLDGATVASLIGVLTDSPADAAVAVTDRWELSLTAWRAEAAGALRRVWDGGARSLHALVTGVPHVEVPVSPAALRNVNTPEELSAAEDRSR